MKALRTTLNDFNDSLPVLREGVVVADLLGRYFAIKQMNAKRAQFFTEGAHGNVPVQHFAEGDIPSVYDEALNWFRDKNVITDASITELERSAARIAKGLEKDAISYITEHINAKLTAIIAEGGNVQAWLDDAAQVFDAIGISELNPSYWKLVMRNATQGAYNGGKTTIYDEADPEEFPLKEFNAINDSRTRAEHAALDNFRAPKDDPIWQRLTPPLGHNCRCTVSLVHKDEGLNASEITPDTSGEGFEFN